MTDETETPEETPAPRLVATTERTEAAAPAPDGPTLEKVTGEAFARQMSSRLLYNHEYGKWVRWDGSRWEVDVVEAHFHDMTEFTNRQREMDPRRTKLASVSFNNNALIVARSSPDMRRKASDFDQDPMLLGTPTGYVNLETGRHRKSDPAKMITKATGVTPMGTAKCPEWLKFINWAFAEDEEIIRYMQKFFGYCLTGRMNEEVLTFIYGSGGNGKGVMLYTIGQVMGDYYQSTPASTFMAKKFNEHPTELARLDGARLVSASETNEGDKWDMSRIKEITGNENPISARFMRKDFFEFWPVCKLLIIGNNKPSIDDVDPAITRRLRLIEMNQKLEEGQVDTGLKAALAEEYPGILRWIIDGAMAWKKEGLAPPAKITETSKAYLKSEDVVGEFVDHALEMRNGGVLLRKDISWALGVYLKQNGFTKKVPATRVYKFLEERRGLSRDERHLGARAFLGINITPDFWEILRSTMDDKGKSLDGNEYFNRMPPRDAEG